MKIPSPRGGPPASRKRFPWSAPITAPAGREHALLARGLPILLIIIIALAALVLSSVGHAQTLDPVLVSNTGQTAGSDLATATGRVSYAQSFTTGVHPDGYFLSSVDVGLKAGSGVTAEVALWWANQNTSEPDHWAPVSALLLPGLHIDDAFGSDQHRATTRPGTGHRGTRPGRWVTGGRSPTRTSKRAIRTDV